MGRWRRSSDRSRRSRREGQRSVPARASDLGGLQLLNGLVSHPANNSDAMRGRIPADSSVEPSHERQTGIPAPVAVTRTQFPPGIRPQDPRLAAVDGSSRARPGRHSRGTCAPTRIPDRSSRFHHNQLRSGLPHGPGDRIDDDSELRRRGRRKRPSPDLGPNHGDRTLRGPSARKYPARSECDRDRLPVASILGRVVC